MTTPIDSPISGTEMMVVRPLGIQAAALSTAHHENWNPALERVAGMRKKRPVTKSRYASTITLAMYHVSSTEV